MASAADQHISSGFSISPSDTSACRPGESDQRPPDNIWLYPWRKNVLGQSYFSPTECKNFDVWCDAALTCLRSRPAIGLFGASWKASWWLQCLSFSAEVPPRSAPKSRSYSRREGLFRWCAVYACLLFVRKEECNRRCECSETLCSGRDIWSNQIEYSSP